MHFTKGMGDVPSSARAHVHTALLYRCQVTDILKKKNYVVTSADFYVKLTAYFIGRSQNEYAYQIASSAVGKDKMLEYIHIFHNLFYFQKSFRVVQCSYLSRSAAKSLLEKEWGSIPCQPLTGGGEEQRLPGQKSSHQQGCARLMSRESNLTRLWLEWVKSELSQVIIFGSWVESELSQSWITWIITWVRVESAKKSESIITLVTSAGDEVNGP